MVFLDEMTNLRSDFGAIPSHNHHLPYGPERERETRQSANEELRTTTTNSMAKSKGETVTSRDLAIVGLSHRPT